MAKPKYDLQPDEAVVKKAAGIKHGSAMALYSDELVLTNYHLILVEKGMFGNTKEVRYYPLNQIKIYNNTAQVRFEAEPSGALQLTAYFFNSQESFGFASEKRRELVEWIKEINLLLTGTEGDTDALRAQALPPGAAAVAETLRDTFGTIKGALGGTSQQNEAPIQVAATCSVCGATFQGQRGQAAQCPYCRSMQQV